MFRTKLSCFCIAICMQQLLFAQTGLNLMGGAAAFSSGAFHVKTREINGQTTPIAYNSEYRPASMFGAQFYHSKGEFPFLLEFAYFKSNFSIDYKDNMGDVYRTQEYAQHIFSGGITVEPLQNKVSRWRYGAGAYVAGYKFNLTSGQSGVNTTASMLNFFVGVEGGIKINSYWYLNAFVRVAPVKTDYVSSFQNLIPPNYNSSEFHMQQRDIIGGIYLSLDFAQWFRDKDTSL